MWLAPFKTCLCKTVISLLLWLHYVLLYLKVALRKASQEEPRSGLR